jgi:glycosyltransferase involved in cell wall biosynthesis
VKIALVHDWLTGMRGGEAVLEAFCRLFPMADIFTLVHVPGKVSPEIEKHKITTSFLQRIPNAEKRYRHFLPLMPWAAESLDVRDYDLVLSSSHCAAKGVKPGPNAVHVCYCHTPMRYIWDQYDAYFARDRAAWPVRAAMALVRRPLQRWDVASSGRVHRFIANSNHVAGRIRRFYGRSSTVIHPPVDVDRFTAASGDKGYYLMLTALVPYKRADLAVEAFNRLKLPLRIVGSGPDMDRLKRMAGPHITFVGWAPRESLAGEFAGCRALIFPGEEDFGIVPVEAMASGKPVIALGRGGALETVVGPDDGAGRPPTGVFFPEETADSLARAVESFESRRDAFIPGSIRKHALSFRRELFEESIEAFVKKSLQEGPVFR